MRARTLKAVYTVLTTVLAGVIAVGCQEQGQSLGRTYTYSPAESTWAVRTALDSLHSLAAARPKSPGATTNYEPRWIVKRLTRDSTGFVVTIVAESGQLDNPIILRVASSGAVEQIPPSAK